MRREQQQGRGVQGTAKAFLDLAAKHYPERLQQFLIVHAPKVFSVLWNAVQPFVDPVTKQKIRFAPYATNLLQLEFLCFF
jgi:hypothetical protein